jgi:tRNA 2-thiouridine synthesizing protein A
MPDDILDLTGLKCPLPALLAKKALRRATSGATLTVLSDDPMAPLDIPFMCHSEGFEVVLVEKNGALVRMTLRRP